MATTIASVIKRPTLGFIFAGAYGFLCLLALAYIGWQSVYRPGEVELAGIFVFVLGLPWSLILTFVVLSFKSSFAWLLTIGYLFSCILNAWLLYKLGALLQRAASRNAP
jgi:hypothetical protein